jgi:hypothetical protein
VLPRTRDYTVRSADLEAGTFDVDLVRHDSGLASDWAFGCRIGDALSFAGPKMSAEVNWDVDWHLLIGDETALPAIGRWLEEAPVGARVRVLVEVPHEDDRQQIPTRADAAITWLVRDPAVRPGHSTLLLETLQGLDRPTGRGFAWCAGETLTIAPIRRFLRGPWGMPKEDVEVVGYWRRVLEEREEQDPSAATGGGTSTDRSPMALNLRIHEMGELIAPVVLRAAVTLDVPGLVSSGTGTRDALAQATGIASQRLDPLLDAMCALDLLRTDGEDDRLLTTTALGEVLLEENVREDLDLADPRNQADLTLMDLLGVLRTGEPALLPSHGHRFDDVIAADPTARKRVEDGAEDALVTALPALLEVPEIAAARDVAVLGQGAVPTALALLGANGDRRVTLLVPVEALAATTRRIDTALPPAARARLDLRDMNGPWPVVGTLLVQSALDGVGDETFLALARAGLEHARDLVVVTDLADRAREDDHVAVRSLVSLTARGHALRTAARTCSLLREAGAAEARTTPLGWGFGPALALASTGRP